MLHVLAGAAFLLLAGCGNPAVLYPVRGWVRFSRPPAELVPPSTSSVALKVWNARGGTRAAELCEALRSRLLKHGVYAGVAPGCEGSGAPLLLDAQIIEEIGATLLTRAELQLRLVLADQSTRPARVLLEARIASQTTPSDLVDNAAVLVARAVRGLEGS
jgi:hypothetical protein